MTDVLVPSALLPGFIVPVAVALPPWVGGGGSGGGGGSSGFQHNQTAAGATWTISHSIGRIPAVMVYVAGKMVLADVDATNSQVVITFASPQSGVAILT